MVSTRASNAPDLTKWIIDSGCTEHIFFFFSLACGYPTDVNVPRFMIVENWICIG